MSRIALPNDVANAVNQQALAIQGFIEVAKHFAVEFAALEYASAAATPNFEAPIQAAFAASKEFHRQLGIEIDFKLVARTEGGT